jgi:membrane protein DedA with SNARE-associated domain/rhodanese-related sulfurtransferase
VAQITSLVQEYGLLIVFLNVLLDEGGLPLPSYPVLLIAGSLTLAGGAPPLAILAAAMAASLTADLSWYLAGRHFGRRALALLCKISLSPDSCVRQTESAFTRFGVKALVFVKFLPGLGLVSVALSGITGLSLPLFLLLDGIGAAIFFTVPIVLGRIFHNAVADIMATLAQLGELGGLIVIAALALYLWILWAERQAFIRQLKMDRITVDELAAMMDSGKTPVILDVRSRETRARDGIIPGALPAHPAELDALLATIPREAEVVIYCACPNEASAATAARHLKKAGFKKIRPLLGGIDAWAQARRPIVTVRDAAA